MRGLDDKIHQNMIKAINQFEECSLTCGSLIPDQQDGIIRNNIAEFKGTYDYYHILLKELEGCIRDYKDLHVSLQRKMFPCVRKMQSELRQKRRS